MSCEQGWEPSIQSDKCKSHLISCIWHGFFHMYFLLLIILPTRSNHFPKICPELQRARYQPSWKWRLAAEEVHSVIREAGGHARFLGDEGKVTAQTCHTSTIPGLWDTHNRHLWHIVPRENVWQSVEEILRKGVGQNSSTAIRKTTNYRKHLISVHATKGGITHDQVQGGGN